MDAHGGLQRPRVGCWTREEDSSHGEKELREQRGAGADTGQFFNRHVKTHISIDRGTCKLSKAAKGKHRCKSCRCLRNFTLSCGCQCRYFLPPAPSSATDDTPTVDIGGEIGGNGRSTADDGGAGSTTDDGRGGFTANDGGARSTADGGRGGSTDINEGTGSPADDGRGRFTANGRKVGSMAGSGRSRFPASDRGAGSTVDIVIFHTIPWLLSVDHYLAPSTPSSPPNRNGIMITNTFKNCHE